MKTTKLQRTLYKFSLDEVHRALRAQLGSVGETKMLVEQYDGITLIVETPVVEPTPEKAAS